MTHKLIILVVFSLIVSCSSTKVYEPSVDTYKVKDRAKYDRDLKECTRVADNISYSDEKVKSAAKGAAVGTGVVAAGAGVVAATGGVVLASVTGPIALAAAGAGALGSARGEGKKEQKQRAIVLNSCLTDRGYKVLSVVE